MIAMSFMTMISAPADEVVAEYSPARISDQYGSLPSSVWVRLLRKGEKVGADLNLSIEDARILAEALTQIVLLHDAAERLAIEKAVA